MASLGPSMCADRVAVTKPLKLLDPAKSSAIRTTVLHLVGGLTPAAAETIVSF